MSLKDVIAYIIKSYPNENELSNARITKIVYLADWHQAINHQKQITNINWYFDSWGPFVWDIKNEVENNPDLFESEDTGNSTSNRKIMISLKNKDFIPNVDDDAKQSINHIIDVTHKLNWDQFIRLIYSTHPIASSSRYTQLDLLKKAEEYAKLK